MTDEQIVENDNSINTEKGSSPQADMSPDVITEDVNIDDVIDNCYINTSSFINQNGVQIEHCLNDEEMTAIRNEAKREAKSLKLNQDQAKQYCQDLYNSYNCSAFVTKRDSLRQAEEDETSWKNRMETSFGERDSDRWNKNMDCIKRGANIAREYNQDIEGDKLDNEIEALKNAGFSEVLKVIQAHNTLNAELTKRHNVERDTMFYGDISQDPNLDNPNYNIMRACKRNREIFKDQNWMKDPVKQKEVSVNDKIINSIYYHS